MTFKNKLLINEHSKNVTRTTPMFKLQEHNTRLNRDRSFDRITFFRNSSVVLSKFVSKEKNRSFEYRHVLYVLSNSVLSKIF
jgi:hypothetical protein